MAPQPFRAPGACACCNAPSDLPSPTAGKSAGPGYDPRALLKLYLYGYLNQIRSSQRLETECHRNVKVMWLLERLYPDYISIAEFRRMRRQAVTAAGAELVRFAKSCGLIRGEVGCSRWKQVPRRANIDTERECFQIQKYLETMEKLNSEQSPEFDGSGVQAALDKLKQHPGGEHGHGQKHSTRIYLTKRC